MSNNDDKKIERFAEIFKALSNPNRLRIFRNLAQLSCCTPSAEYNSIKSSPESKGCACVGELGEELDIAASTISHHLKELRRAGLIIVERRGQKIECRINQETIQALTTFFCEES